MEIEKKRELGSQRLLISTEEETEDFREKMMLENEIRGHIPFNIRRINGRKIYEYNIEGLSSLEEEAGRKLGFPLIKSLVSGLSETIDSGAPFLLREDDYVVTPGTVFFDKEGKELKLVYCPGYGQNLKERLEELMEYCLDTIDYNDGLAVRSAYGLYMKVRDGCSFRRLKDFVEEIEETGKEDPGQPTPRDRDDLQPVSLLKEYPEAVPPCPVKRTPIQVVRDLVDGADKRVRLTLLAVLGGYAVLTLAVLSGKFEVLSRRVMGIPVWIPLMVAAAAVCVTIVVRTVKSAAGLLGKTQPRKEEYDDNETVLMIGSGTRESLILVSDGMPGLSTDRFPCVVGKDSAYCDLAVDAKGVSRKHFRIDRNSRGEITVEDLNTINGTFLNGHKLAPNMSVELREGDELSFGSVSYYVNHLE
ncbi:MAG: FHA domain-containing protein [Lachnospiraceae bacterium]|nr:FHA domain-containing protein [Lachnospiraceae bacterium]